MFSLSRCVFGVDCHLSARYGVCVNRPFFVFSLYFYVFLRLVRFNVFLLLDGWAYVVFERFPRTYVRLVCVRRAHRRVQRSGMRVRT